MLSPTPVTMASRHWVPQGPATPVRLTARERDVLQLLCQACSNAEIAERLLSRRLPAVAVALAAALLIGATSATLLATAGVRHALTDATTGELPAADLRTFGLIAGRNLCAVLGLFTGVVTGGIGSVVFLLAIGATLGWSVGVSLDVLGAAETLSRAWLYTPFEVGGLVLAGAAGLLPLVTSLGQHRGETTRSDRFARALRWLGVAVVLILVGAAAETLAIALHS